MCPSWHRTPGCRSGFSAAGECRGLGFCCVVEAAALLVPRPSCSWAVDRLFIAKTVCLERYVVKGISFKRWQAATRCRDSNRFIATVISSRVVFFIALPEHAGSTHGIDTAAEAHCHAILMLTAVTKLKIRFVFTLQNLASNVLLPRSLSTLRSWELSHFSPNKVSHFTDAQSKCDVTQ